MLAAGKKAVSLPEKNYPSFLNGLAKSATGGNGFGQEIACRPLTNFIFIIQIQP